MLKPKVGDLVRLKPVRVMGGDDSCGIRVTLAIAGQATESRWAYVPPELIEEILPRPVAVGDTVKIKAMVGSPARFTILAIHEGEAWMQQITSVTSGHSTYRLEAIEHAED